MQRTVLMCTLAASLVVTEPAAAAPPATWDGLVQVPSKKAKLAYLQPGADFSRYTKVLIEEPDVAFQKDWRRDYNRSHRSLSGQVSESDVQEAVSQGVVKAGEIFAQAWTKGGYTVVNAPGPDVLRVRVGIVNIRVSAPDRQTSGRSHSFSGEAGSATLFVEARDSETNALLGRAVDQRLAGDNPNGWRTAVSNRGDFRDLVRDWATAGVRAMTELKSRSPVKP